MDLEQFTSELVRILKVVLEGECEVRVEKLQEYYGRTPYKIMFLKQDSTGGYKLVTEVYPENYYEYYFSGQKELDEIGEMILDFYDKTTGQLSEEYAMINDYSRVRNRLSFMFINRQRNENSLKELVHIDYGDIVLIFNVVFIDKETYKMGSARVSHDMVKKWGISEEQFCVEAFMSAPNITPPRIMTESETICACLDVPFKGDDKAGMYVVTNSFLYMGSGVILYKGIGALIEKKTGYKDFYVLPSSRNEMLLVPVDMHISADGLKQMLVEVNGTEVSSQDYLSDSIYTYSTETEEFKIYGKEQSHEEQ